MLATVSDRKCGVEDTVDFTELINSFDEGGDGWLAIGASSWENSSGALEVTIDSHEEAYIQKQVHLSSGGEGCTYTLCLELTARQYEGGFTLLIKDNAGDTYYNYDVEDGYQSCFENLTLPEDIQIILQTNDNGIYELDNVSLTRQCLEFDHYLAEVESAHDFFPFGSEVPGRSFQGAEGYRYGFNGMERDDEVKGSGNSYTSHFRQYDPRLGRWLSIDPEFMAFPWQSPYVAFDNNPINKVDPRGDAAGDPPYKIQGGVMSGDGVTNNITSTTQRPKLKTVSAIVLHRTVSSSASSAITTTKNNKGATGFHIVVDTDGSITQVNNLSNRANHVGKPSGSVSNFNSIGIEVVGMPVDKDGKATTVDKDIVGWQDLTPEQTENTAQAVSSIMQEYDIGFDAIFPHEDVSAKTEGEGQTVLNSIQDRVGELMQDYIQKKSESQARDSHKKSNLEQKSIVN